MSSTSSLAFFLSHHLFFFIFLNVRHVRLFVCFFLATDRFLRPIKSLLGVVPRRPFHNPPSSTSPDFGGAVRNPADNAAGISGISSGNLHTHTHTHTHTRTGSRSLINHSTTADDIESKPTKKNRERQKKWRPSAGTSGDEYSMKSMETKEKR